MDERSKENADQQAVRALQAEIYAQELKKLEQEYQQLLVRIADVENTIKALDMIKAKKNFSALSPVGTGVYMRVDVKNVDEVLVSITSKYAANMTVEKAREFLEEMRTKLENAAKEVEKQFSAIDSQLQEIVAEIQSKQRE